MKYLIILLSMFAVSAHAQTVTTGAASGSVSNVDNTSIAVANGAPGAPGIANLSLGVNPSVAINSTGSDLGKQVPLTSAPQMTILGGEDSCLKSRAAAMGLSGFGGSFGTMVMDNECNRRVLSKTLMGYQQPELAVAVLCGSPQMWAAAERVARFKRARGANVMSVCHNEQPSSADVVSVTMRSGHTAETMAVGGGSEDGLPWSYNPRKEDDFIYSPIDDE